MKIKFSNREFLLLAIILALLSIISLNFFYQTETENTEENELVMLLNQNNDITEPNLEGNVDTEENFELKKSMYVIDVKGAILHPGVYELEEGKRVIDAVNLAGGFLEEANVNKVNLASLLVDEMVIYIPVIGEEGEFAVEVFQTAGVQNNANEGMVNINIANAETLQTLPGIGPSKAEAIITYREEQGTFQKVEDLLNVTGIGEKSLDKMRDKIILK